MSFMIAGSAEVSSMALSTVMNVPTSNTPIMRCLSFSIPKSIDPPCGRVVAARRAARSRRPGGLGLARVPPPSLSGVSCPLGERANAGATNLARAALASVPDVPQPLQLIFVSCVG